jgi:hypothetical protein
VHRVLPILCSKEVVIAQLAKAVTAAAVGFVLGKLSASAKIPAHAATGCQIHQFFLANEVYYKFKFVSYRAPSGEIGLSAAGN